MSMQKKADISFDKSKTTISSIEANGADDLLKIKMLKYRDKVQLENLKKRKTE